MGRRTSRRRLSSAAAALAALALVGSGCTAVRTSRDDPADGPLLASRLNAAVRDHSPTAFVANFAGPRASVLGYRWYGLMAATGATVSAQSGTQLAITWTVRGDRQAARTVLATTVGSLGGRPVITAVTLGDREPVWAVEFLSVTDAAHGTLLTSRRPSAELRGYAARLDAAVAAVAAADVVSPQAAWNGQAVLELPEDAADFTSVTGFAADDAAGVTGCDDGTPRIVMNPELDDAWFDTTLMHEVVHAATNSPCSTSYAWAVEGLAEWVTERADARVVSENRDLVDQYLAAHGIPDSLPDPVRSATDYALAAVAVDQVFAHLRHARAVDLLDRFVRRGGISDEQWDSVTTWYTAELAGRSA